MPADNVGDWSTPSCLPAVSENEVHIWRAFLDHPSDQLRHFESLLSADEITRARKYRFPVHQDRFVSRRGILRLVLARYLNISASELHFDYTEYGKPLLASRHGTKLQFNISFTHDLALVAVAFGRDVGVDVEKIDDTISSETIPEQFFSAHETAALRALPAASQTAAFFDCWTRKEAYIKARGMGLSLPLDSFDVSFGDGKPARLLRTGRDPGEAAQWAMMSLHPAPGHAAALVVEGQECVVHCWSCHSAKSAP